MTQITVSSREIIPSLSYHFNDNQELATIVRDYCQTPNLDSVTWDVAKKHFNGNQGIMGIVQEYHYGVSIEYLNIAERVQSMASSEILDGLSVQVSCVQKRRIECAPEEIDEIKNACLFVASHVDLFARSKILHNENLIKVARLVLNGINLLNPVNFQDPITLEEIPDDDLLMTLSGQRFSLTNLLEFHHQRNPREDEYLKHKFLINPLNNESFPWHDVQTVMIAALKSGKEVFQLHMGALVPEESEEVLGWDSLHHFYNWLQANLEDQEDHAIRALINATMIHQKNQNDSLQKSWKCILPLILKNNPSLTGFPFAHDPADMIRSWMRSNPTPLEKITHLELQDLNLPCVPLEISLFTGLKRLNLNDNALIFLSPGLFNRMTALKGLYLQNNELELLVPGVFDGLLNLERLNLEHNQLSTLPGTLFAGLTALQKLSLNHNETAALPPSLFNDLTNLNELYLHNNALQTLPSIIFDRLSRLQILCLNSNQLDVLPFDLFRSLNGLQELSLHYNQLLISWEDLPDDANNIGFPKVMDAFFNYKCISPFAGFYQLAASGASPDAVQRAFYTLEAPLKNAIYKMVYEEAGRPDHETGWRWGEGHVFDSMQIFNRALKRLVKGNFERLDANQKKIIYGHVYALEQNGRDAQGMDDSDAYSNIPRLIDAMGRSRGIKRRAE